MREPPQRLGEAGEIGRAILTSCYALNKSDHSYYQPIRMGKSELGTVFELRTQRLGNPWSALGVISPDLALAVMSLHDEQLVFANQQIPIGISMCTIGDLFHVGPTHHNIGSIPKSKSPSGVFDIFPVQGDADSVGADRCMWHADAKKQICLLSTATHKGIPKAGVSSKKLNDVRQTASSLFYCKNLRWTSQKLLSTMSEIPYLGGNAWVSLTQDDSRIQNAFCIWSNSTLGMIFHWSVGQRTQNGRSLTKLEAVKKIKCPNLFELSSDRLSLASRLFESFKNQSLLPLCQAHVDDVRKRFDDAVIEILGLPEDSKTIIEKLRFQLCNEPSVHGYNKTALAQIGRPQKH